MRKQILTTAISIGLLLGSAAPGLAVTHHRRHHHSSSYVRHKRHMKTVKRVGIGAAGGAAIGAVAGHGKGAATGAIAGAGAGALYDKHEKDKGKY